MKLQDQFFVWFHTEFAHEPLFTAMTTIVEASPWHREASVAVHTSMVVAEYMKLATPYIHTDTNDDWNRQTLCGAFACAFHDVGKPPSRFEKFSETRGVYFSYPGHEQVSARLWEDWAVTNWSKLQAMGLITEDIYRIGWMIEYHLPYKTAKPEKVRKMVNTVTEMMGDGEVFGNVLLADQFGRVSDNLEVNRAEVVRWVEEFRQQCSNFTLHHNTSLKPRCFMLIGASGSGKSTYTKEMMTNREGVQYYSWDDLRLQWYGGTSGNMKQDYQTAYQLSTEDKQFATKTQQAFIQMLNGNDIIVDNTNLGTKRRHFFVDAARRKGYEVVGVVFPITKEELHYRISSRTDKFVPWETVKQMYMSIQYPSFGEMDKIDIVDSNL
jgi:predicted kinase